MKTATALLLLAGTSLAACVAVADATDDVRCREIGFSRAAEMRDAKAFAAFIDDDARFVGESVVRGPQSIVAAWSPFFAPDGPSITWRPRFVEVLEDGSLALTRGPYRVTAVDEDGRIVERWGTFNSVWRKQSDGDWKVVFDAGNAASAPPADDIRALIEAPATCEPGATKRDQAVMPK